MYVLTTPVGKEHKDSMLLEGRRAAFSAVKVKKKKKIINLDMYFRNV